MTDGNHNNASIRIQRSVAFFSLFLFLGKIYAWYLTRSVAILTDALESIINVLMGFLGLFSVILAAKPKDKNHPYGHGKVEFVSSALEGLLIAIAGVFIFFEGIYKLIYKPALEKLDIGAVIIFATGLINYLVGRYAIKEGKKNRSIVVEAEGKHILSDAYSTFGITFGLILMLFTRWYWLDSVVALLFAAIISITGYNVLRRSLAGIMDEANETLLKEVIDFLQEHRRAQWVDFHNLRVIEYGDVLHIDAHLTLPWYYQVADVETEIHGLEDMIKAHFHNRLELFIHIDACKSYQCHLCALIKCPARKQSFECQLTWTLDLVRLNAKHGSDAGDDDE